MADLKRNVIELVKEVKQGEIVTEKYVTPIFIPLSTVYEALDLISDLRNRKSLDEEKTLISNLISFVAEKVYGGQFTAEDLKNGLHAPNTMDELFNQVLFIARGEQTDEAKKYFQTKK